MARSYRGPPGRGAGVNGALSMTGLQLGFMFGGVLVVEEVFTRPGLRSRLSPTPRIILCRVPPRYAAVLMGRDDACFPWKLTRLRSPSCPARG